MKLIVSCARHAAMFCRLEFLGLNAVILVIMLTYVPSGSTQTRKDIKLVGSLRDNEVIIGSNINLTFTTILTPTSSCMTSWQKNSKSVFETIKDRRIRSISSKRVGERCSETKLIIRNFTSSDAGAYKCKATIGISDARLHLDTEESTPLVIYAVICYQGYYCPTSEINTTPKRCPVGTFSPYKNATSVEDCIACPTDMTEREKWMKTMSPKTVTMFETNCEPLFQERKSSLSTGAKVVIIVLPVVATLAVVVGILYGFHRRKLIRYREKLLSPFTEVDYDPPKVPRSKDVFICYSSKNRQWVHEVLFPKLKAQDFKVFIDFVDFEIGKTIDDNIVKGIYGSRKTLFILSRDSLKSLYARKELYHALAAGKTGHQVLVILYEKCKAPAEIADFVYLDWTEEKNSERFWDKLYSAIRRPLANEVVHV